MGSVTQNSLGSTWSLGKFTNRVPELNKNILFFLLHCKMKLLHLSCLSQWDLPTLCDYRQVPLIGAGCFRQVAALHSDHHRQVPLVGAGCFRQVAALHSDHHRQVPLVGAGCFRQVAALHSDPYRQAPLLGLAASERQLPLITQ